MNSFNKSQLEESQYFLCMKKAICPEQLALKDPYRYQGPLY